MHCSKVQWLTISWVLIVSNYFKNTWREWVNPQISMLNLIGAIRDWCYCPCCAKLVLFYSIIPLQLSLKPEASVLAATGGCETIDKNQKQRSWSSRSRIYFNLKYSGYGLDAKNPGGPSFLNFFLLVRANIKCLVVYPPLLWKSKLGITWLRSHVHYYCSCDYFLTILNTWDMSMLGQYFLFLNERSVMTTILCQI